MKQCFVLFFQIIFGGLTLVLLWVGSRVSLLPSVCLEAPYIAWPQMLVPAVTCFDSYLRLAAVLVQKLPVPLCVFFVLFFF